MLEDESGRLRLVGAPLTSELLVTGCIIAVMGTENANGDFEVIDIRLPDFPRQPRRWERDDKVILSKLVGKKQKQKRRKSRGPDENGGKVAIVSGLGISSDEANNLTVDLLMEYLLGEAASHDEEGISTAGQITRLIIAGDSLAEATPVPRREEEVMSSTKKANRKYGYDSSTYNPAPIAHLDTLLSTLLPVLPVTLIPGASDPANVSMPQQPIHPAMFPRSRAYSAPFASSASAKPATAAANTARSSRGGPNNDHPGDSNDEAKDWFFDATTNPWEGDVQGWRMLGAGGQNLDDVFKYVEDDVGRLEMMEQMLRWRCCAPTAPDTLCKHSFPLSSYLASRPWDGYIFFAVALIYQTRDV